MVTIKISILIPLLSNLRCATVAQNSLCFDAAGWYDIDGEKFDCQWYSEPVEDDDYYNDEDTRCELYGNNELSSNFGMTAGEACCTCGGGFSGDGNTVPSQSPSVSLRPTTSYTPTISPTVSYAPTIYCRDIPQWFLEADIFTCDWFTLPVGDDDLYYAEGATRCEVFGSILNLNGISANQACCVCGGGVFDKSDDPVTLTRMPSVSPINLLPTIEATTSPTIESTTLPTISNGLTTSPIAKVTNVPTTSPTGKVTDVPTFSPIANVTDVPTFNPTGKVTDAPTFSPSGKVTDAPSISPTAKVTDVPTFSPTANFTDVSTFIPTEKVTDTPTFSPTTEKVTDVPTFSPTIAEVTGEPTLSPTVKVTDVPTFSPTTAKVTDVPTFSPTTAKVTGVPTFSPTGITTDVPTINETNEPSLESVTSTNVPSAESTPDPSDVNIVLLVVRNTLAFLVSLIDSLFG